MRIGSMMPHRGTRPLVTLLAAMTVPLRTAVPLLFLLAASMGCGCTDGNISSSNNPPEVVIQQPVEGAVLSATSPVELRGRVVDRGAGGGIEEIAWTSDLSNVIFEGLPDDDEGNTRVLWDAEAGEHTLTLRATDIAGATARESITITVLDDQAPICAITSPTGEVVLDSSQPVLLQGQVDDDNTPVTELAIAWSSDVDGPLGGDPPNDLGVVSAEATISTGDHELTLEVTDGTGLTCTDSVVVSTNAAPSPPGIAFEPNPPSIDEDLTAVVTSESIDPEGEEVEYTFRWFLGDDPYLLDPGFPADTIPSSELARDQVWTIEVYGVDPNEVPSEASVLTTVVPDSPPGAPVVEIDPAAPTQGQNLVCQIATPSDDPDGDPVDYTYAWQRDGSPTALTGSLLGWEETAVGEDWTCVVTPDDGTLVGEAGEATVTVDEGCLSYEGAGPSSQVIVLDDAALRLGSGDFTVEAWIKPSSLSSSGDRAVASKRGLGSDNGWHFGVDADGHPFFHVSIGANPRLDSTGVVGVGDWHHVALVFAASSGVGTFFVDGDLAGTGSLAQPNGSASDDMNIGNDAAGLADQAWDGLVDDLRISGVARYTLAFIPDTSLEPDADTIAMWSFEEGGGTDVNDASLNGQDGLMAGGGWSTDSTCGLNLAPTEPGLTASPAYPDADDDLLCELLVPSVDPEGAGVTYDGVWLVDGAPSANTFTAFPATLPASATADGQEWTCQATASDASNTSTPGSAALYVGSMPVCEFTVVDPASAGSLVCGFEAPIEGLLRFTMSNPDSSADGQFIVDGGTLGTTWIFTGFKDWAYGGSVVLPWAEQIVEMNVGPALGPMSLTLEYDPTPGSTNTGPDGLTVEFVFYDELDAGSASLIGADFVASADAGNGTPPATSGSATLGSGDRILVEADPCGSAGAGGHGVYASNDGSPGNDGLIRVDTGSADTCAIPLRSVSLPAGAWDFSIVHEDDFWTDNSGDRGLGVYSYTP